MGGAKYSFKKLDPNNKKDMEGFLNFTNKLNTFLKSVAKPLTDEQIKWQKMRFADNDEATFFCVCEDKIVGYINICNYHVVDGKRPNDNIGMISDIMVEREHSNAGENAFILLQMGIEELLKNGKESAIMMVQEDNENRFLHFALADKVLSQKECTRNNGEKTINYKLMLSNLKVIQELKKDDLIKRYIRIMKKFREKQQVVTYSDSM